MGFGVQSPMLRWEEVGKENHVFWFGNDQPYLKRVLKAMSARTQIGI